MRKKSLTLHMMRIHSFPKPHAVSFLPAGRLTDRNNTFVVNVSLSRPMERIVFYFSVPSVPKPS